MKTVGILGGFGPESTAKFQLEIVDMFRARKIKTRPSILVWNTPTPLKIERDLVLKSKGVKAFLPLLVDGAERLNKAGANFLVIPCNTLHILMEEFCRLIKLPVLSIVEETAKALHKSGVKEIGILGTKLLLESKLHQECLKLHGMRSILPSDDDQDLINRCIHLILDNKNAPWVENTLLRILKKLKAKNVEDILLACTDLKPFIPNLRGVKIYDTLQILANATVNKMVNERR